MSTFVLTDARIEVNSVNISTWCSSVTLSVEADEQENTAFGGNGYRSRLAGLKDWSVDLDFFVDFAASAIDQTIWPLFATNTTIKIRPTTGAISTTNPEYTGSILVKEYTPIDGGVGDVATSSVSWTGNGVLTRNTT